MSEEEDVGAGAGAGEIEKNDGVDRDDIVDKGDGGTQPESEKLFENLKVLGGEKEKPADKPVVVEGEIEGDRAGLEKIPKEAHESMVKERIRLRKLAKTLEQKERDLGKPPESSSDAGRDSMKRDAGSPAQVGEKISKDDLALVFRAAVKAKAVLAGGFDERIDEAKAKEILKAFDAARSGLDSEAELLDLRDGLLSGRVPGGREVAELVEAEFPFVQQRAGLRGAELRKAQEADATAQKRVGDTFAKVFEQFPEFKMPEDGDVTKATPEAKFSIEYMKAELDDDDRKKILADPEKRLPKIYQQIKNAWLAKNAVAFKQEKEMLEKRLSAGTGPLDGRTRPGSGSNEGVKESDKIMQRLKAMAGESD